ncbi:hypothetical protein GRW18_25195 [Escherichia coli]|nr:hypothetical protein [Escherichia coli]EFH5799498.1 hypothetical protein [Escherichia coli]EFM1702677.1 hypothetical protein [Escherichia coli]EIC1390840.1 hypothetical protein [Escherichia coli]EJZ0693779.1 hypothetical protein [Escherichia coli]
MARFDIDTGSYPVQRRAKIAGCGFNLPDIRNPLFREPELKLYPWWGCRTHPPPQDRYLTNLYFKIREDRRKAARGE